MTTSLDPIIASQRERLAAVFRAFALGLLSVLLTTFHLAGLLELPFALLLGTAFAAIAVLREKGLLPRLPTALWTAIFLALFLALAADTVFGSGSLIDNSFRYLVFLLLYRYANLETGGDYFQFILFSFLGLVLASVLSFELSYLGLFGLFVFLVLVLLILHAFLRNLEETALAERADQRLFAPALLLPFSLVVGLVLVLDLLIFLIIPRIDFGFFYRDQRRAPHLSGFGQDVTLGDLGTILEDPSVAFRVEFPGRQGPPPGPLYFPGRTYDHYDGRRWSRSVRRGATTTSGKILRELCLDEGAFLVQKYFLAPFPSEAVFALRTACRYRVSENIMDLLMQRSVPIERDWYGDLVFTSRQEANRIYQVESLPAEAYPGDHDDLRPYLQLPGDDARMAELAASIAGGTTSGRDAAATLVAYFHNTFGYTLEQTHEGPGALHHFLFEDRRGHCEYFATAMVLLLRRLGRPARLVAGYRGGQWNELGSYLILRQHDAHSWVEVADGGLWSRYDPTPPLDETFEARPGVFDRYYDFLRHRWEKYVLYYNLRTQLGHLEHLKKFSWHRLHTISELWRGLRGQPEEGKAGPSSGPFIVLGILGLLGFFLFTRARRRPLQPRFYRQLLTLLRRRGYRLRKHETWDEFLARHPSLHKHRDLGRLLALHRRVSFGRQPLSEDLREEAARLLRRLEELR
ncbi:MAG: hypothetical protein A2284_04030 [Deltaproteobacteria bacterium RIFOXYA12_FULL_61_11]|nr:MAG: hypothetical protein A2284_04030 [Deltaproteobacteria bacterium RIFOXYA12_FULL_61_11]